MAIRITLSILINLALGFTSMMAIAANVMPLKGAFQDQAKAGPVPRPEPAELRADWWRYFAVTGEELDERIIEMSQRLDALLIELPRETEAAATPLVQRLETSMDALAQARAQPSPEAPGPITYRENYTIRQLLDIAERLHKLRMRLETERADIASAEEHIVSAQQGIDTRLVAYLTIPTGDRKRILHGLEIMVDRLAIAVARERVRVRKATLIAEETLANQLADEQTAATKRLTAERAELGSLEAEIWQAKSALKQAQEQLIAHRTQALSVVPDSPTAQAAVPHRFQQAIHSAVSEALATLQLIGLQIEYELAALLAGALNVDLPTLRKRLAEWKTQTADIRQRSTTWERESRRERNRATGELAVLPAGTTTEVTPLTQVLYQDRVALAQKTLVALQRLQGQIARADLLVKLLNTELAQREGWLRTGVAEAKLVLLQFWNRTLEWVTFSLFKIGDTPVTTLGLLRVALVLFIAWLISYWLRRVIRRLAVIHEGVSESAVYTVQRLSHYTLITIGFIVGLSSIGLDFTNFAVVAGAIGIGIGFGLQSIVNNFVSGLILLFERTLKVGDFVELASGVAGEVRAINVRSTVINTNDNVDIVVPNSEFTNANVINWTLLEANRRIHIPFRVAYGVDIDLMTKAVLEAAEQTPHTLKTKKPGVWLVDFAESSLQFELVVWINPAAVKRPGAVNAAYKLAIERALRQYKFEIPFPQRDLHLRNGFQALFPQNPTTAGDTWERANR